jgi:Domain of unknown function (DUF4157)
MRLPWQRRNAGSVDAGNASASELKRHAWNALPALRAGIDTKPPLTAQSVELADSLSRRLRSTGERPRLIHRSGLPEAASAGTVRGLATASVPSQRSRALRSEPGDGEGEGPDSEADAADRVGVAPSAPPTVVARRRPTRLLSAADAALGVMLQRAVEPSSDPRVEETDPGSDAGGDAPSIATPQPGLQHTVIRRRPGFATPRPLGLQAPLIADDTGQPGLDAAAGRRDEHGARETAPRAVAATVGRLHRADVTDVQVRRDREAELLAASEHARAVTRGGEVFIPASEGRLDSGRGSGLLAHELTHVIQQRRLGRSVPLEHSPAGRRLEADAAMTERHVRGDLGAPAPAPTAAEPPSQPVAAPQPPAGDDGEDAATARDIQEDLVASGRAFRLPDGSLVFPGAGGHLPEQRSTPVQTAVAIQRAPAQPGSAESHAGEPIEASGLAAGSGSGLAPAPELWPAPAPAPSAGEAPPASQERPPEIASTPATFAPAGETPAPAPAVPVAEEAAPIDLDDLARRVYGQVRTQLRSELLIDRERAGLLTDFR